MAAKKTEAADATVASVAASERACKELELGERVHIYDIGMEHWTVLLAMSKTLYRCGLSLEVVPAAHNANQLAAFAARRGMTKTVNR